MSNMTINAAIEAIRANLNDDEAWNVINSKSRFTADQKAAIAELQDALASCVDITNMDEEVPAPLTMAEKLRKARQERYVLGVSPTGAKSANCGDALAQILEGMNAEQVCELADEFTPLEKGDHATKYANLNPGARRMNAGNKLRAALKRGELEIVESKSGRVSLRAASE